MWVENVLFRRDVAWFEVGLPIEICEMVSPFLNGLVMMRDRQGERDMDRTAICSGVQTSKSIDLTLLIWVPMPRWIPEQRMHRKTPLREREWENRPKGSRRNIQIPWSPAWICCCWDIFVRNIWRNYLPFRLQSAHTLLSCRLTRSRRVLVNLSDSALSCLDMVLSKGNQMQIMLLWLSDSTLSSL